MDCTVRIGRVSVDEFKKLLGASDSGDHRPQQSDSSSMNNRELTSASSYATTNDYEDDDENAAADQTRRNYRQIYASKIITKFMSKDSFLDIASENLKILNKSVWSFGSFLRNDLTMCSGLSSKVDLFCDAEVAVKKALQPSFEQFSHTKEFVDLLRNARLTYALVAEEMASAAASTDKDQNSPSTTSDDSSDYNATLAGSSGPPSVSKSASYLTIERVLGNRRLCSIFWVFLFKERTHEQLSLWMDFRYHLIPLLTAFIDAAKADISQDNLDEDPDQDEDDEEVSGAQQVETRQQHHPQPGELIEQLLLVGGRISSKYLAVDAGTFVTFVGEAERELLAEYERRVALCMDAGSFSLADAEVMLRTVQRIAAVIEYDLKVNHFVRFMGSASFKSLVSCYQSRLLSPSASNRITGGAGDSPEDTAMGMMSSSTASSSSDSSMTTLQELFHCMSVPSHQPQRIRSKKFTLRDLFQSQIRGESPSKSLISSVISFRLDASDRANPRIEKNVLHTLATAKDADMRHHHAIPDHVEAFFCPSGAEIIRAKSCPEPKLFHMTIGNSEKAFYGACLTRYVPQSDDSQLGPLELVLRETEGLEVYVPVGLCLISRYPILDTLKKRLNDMHLGIRSGANDERYFSDPHWVPDGAQMGELLSPFDFTTISTTTTSSSNSLTPSLPNLTNYVDFSMEELFNCLSIENVVALVTCMLLERQVVLLSSRYSVLTCVGETLKSLIAPLVWSHVFAPILPKSMLECLQCPTPYLFGVHASYQNELFEMLSREGSCDSIVLVDLDADTLSTAVQPHLPDALRQPLHSTLQQLLKPRVFFSDYVPMCGPGSGSAAMHSRRFPERRVRLCFQHTVAQLLDRLEEFRFVLSDDFDYVVVFDRVAFLRSLPNSEVAFFRAFLETQVFSHEIASVA